MRLVMSTALQQIEQSIHQALRLKMLKLTATFVDVPALRSYATQSSGLNATRELTAVFVTSTGFRWEWSTASLTADDGFAVVKPADVAGSSPGRWLITSSSVTSGYLAAVNYWQGETRKKEFQERILAARPSVAIVYESSSNDPRSTIPGAIYDYPCKFSIWCIDENMRPNYEALFGSAYSADSDHPGAMQILGDVKKVLADENKKVTTPTDGDSGPLGLGGGAKLITIGQEDVEDADLAEHVIIMSLGIEIVGSVENPDADSDHVQVSSIYLQPDLTELHGESEFDPDNFIDHGYSFVPQMGLTATPSSGTATISGLVTSSSPIANTFSALCDTYCDLNRDGTITYLSTGNAGAAPPVTLGALRIGVVVTDSSGIISFAYLTATSSAFDGNWQLVPMPDVE